MTLHDRSFTAARVTRSGSSRASSISDTAVRDGGAMGRPGYATYVGQLTLGASFQARVGPVAVRGNFRAVHASFDLRPNDSVFSDQTYDLQLPNDGWSVINDADFLWISDFGLVVGARYTVATPLDEDWHFVPGEDRAPAQDHVHRLGPIIAYTVERNPNARFDAPTLLLLAQWHVIRRFRTGQDIDTGLSLPGPRLPVRGRPALGAGRSTLRLAPDTSWRRPL